MTDRVDQMWGTDMTQTVTIVEGRAYRYTPQARTAMIRLRAGPLNVLP